MLSPPEGTSDCHVSLDVKNVLPLSAKVQTKEIWGSRASGLKQAVIFAVAWGALS